MFSESGPRDNINRIVMYRKSRKHSKKGTRMATYDVGQIR